MARWGRGQVCLRPEPFRIGARPLGEITLPGVARSRNGCMSSLEAMDFNFPIGAPRSRQPLSL